MGEDLGEQLRHAIFTPAIQKPYAFFAVKRPQAVRQMPGGLVPADLNFLSSDSKLFHFPAALYSVGQFSFNQMAKPKPCMVLNRNRKETLILGDSGGFQILTNKLKIRSDKDRASIFDWLEKHVDFGMTLDVPTAKAQNYEQFEKCLGDTKEHLKYWRKRYPNGQGQGNFLNVLQGGQPAWMNEWDDLVSDEIYSGWAIAGKNKKSLYHVLKRLLKLIDDDKINKKQFWVHFLGVSDLTSACLLSAIQKNFADLLGDTGFHISYDASNPFSTLGRHRRVYTGYVIKRSGLRLPEKTLDTANPKHIGSKEPFPYANESPIGRLLTMGDLIVNRPKNGVGLDSLGDYMLMNHNVYVHMKGVIEANKLFAADYSKARHHFPVAMLDAREAIREIVRDENAFDCLDKHEAILAKASAR